MTPIYLIIVALLAATALAKEIESIECSFGGSTGTRHCHGAEGNQLIFHLSNEANTELNLIKDGKYRILKRQNNGIFSLDETYVSQFEKISNGKYKIGEAAKKHTGEYQLEEYGPDGKLIKKAAVNLTIHVPVSEPFVSQTCSSPEPLTLSCSGEGEKIKLTLFLDNLLIQTKPQTTDKESPSNVTINFHGQLAGNPMCEVHNDTGSEQKTIHFISCEGTTFLTVVVMAVVIVLLLLLIVVLSVKLLRKKTTPVAVKEDDAQEDVVYSAVAVTQNQTSSL